MTNNQRVEAASEARALARASREQLDRAAATFATLCRDLGIQHHALESLKRAREAADVAAAQLDQLLRGIS